MNGTDQQKLIKAGWTILRPEGLYDTWNGLKIKFKGNGSHEWRTLEKGFQTKAALLRRMNELLKDEKTVQD